MLEDMDSPLSTRAVLLAALGHGRGYGSDLMDRAKALYGLQLSAGSVYPCLAEMEYEGLIREKKVITETRACYYVLTRRGEEELRGYREIVMKVYGGKEKEEESSE